MRERCRTIKARGDDGEPLRVFVPGCMGGAVYGPSGCTCTTAPATRAELEDRVEVLEREVQDLKEEVRRLRQKTARAAPAD